MIQLQSKATLPTQYGDFKVSAFAHSEQDSTPILVISSQLDSGHIPLVRLHSECITGEVFGSLKCDCKQQLDAALSLISQFGGHLIYLRQEGRGIGIINKLKAYTLQEQGYDTVDANIHLGFEPDLRDYSEAGEILNYLEIKRLKLITNNPEKIEALRNLGFEIVERVPLIIESQHFNKKYLDDKRNKMGHLL